MLFKITKHYWFILLAIFILSSCGDDDSMGPDTEIPEASSQKQFVWNAMNFWYYWQGDVPNLADDRFSSDDAFQQYLNRFTDDKALFDSLKYIEDDFSFFINDYEAFEQSQQGISRSFGYQFGLVERQNSDDIFGYVQYVLPDTPAEEAGLQRGDVFTKVNGTQLTRNNGRSLLQTNSTYELSLAQIQNNTISETGETISLTAETLQENPVYLDSVYNTGSSNVGYLVYNSFQINSHPSLNDVFGNFLTQNIDELVVDLRYNGGGALITTQMLAGMISGLDESQTFAEYTYSEKLSVNDSSFSILDEVPIANEQGNFASTESMNKLSLDRVYFLVDFGTASASEALINGLKPYMNVILIGGKTVGKDEASLTLYDSPPPYSNDAPPYSSKENINSNHKHAIQPIVLKIVNNNGQDYPEGFIPEHPLDEVSLLDGLPPLGDTSEPYLLKALELISGGPIAKAKYSGSFEGQLFMDSHDLQPHDKEMYLTTEELKNIEF